MAERIAFEFIGFEAGQWVVEIVDSDQGFQTNAPCGTWSSASRLGSQITIGSGVWVVGTQVTPGLYQSSASPGCYWERLRDFRGEADSIAASEVVPATGTRFVTIAAGDAGFRSDEACGTWTRVERDSPR